MIEIHILHFILGILLFLIINWVGKHSYSVGYMQISMFLKEEEAPAFNFIFRIISPLVYLFIISAILYKIELDKFVYNIYFVSIYYIVFRLLFNLLTNRRRLMNWNRQIIYWISIITISYFSYTEIISKKENLLPDFETISNKLWIIIIIFLFHTLNQVRFSSDKTIKRKQNYLESRLSLFKEKYGDLVNDKITNEKLKSIIYAIMIYEDFNRPKAIRLVENIRFKLTKKKHSLGLMQVQTTEYINDKESVILGIEKIKKTYEKGLKKIDSNKNDSEDTPIYKRHNTEWKLSKKIISNYNKDYEYVYEVNELACKIFSLNKSKQKKYLLPNYNGERYYYNEEE
ncbi:hypothetical protein [Tenacibaculum piscium]|uniref:hypothetical protein n=1 Tax=Tenacibaculum piscium TaxID=1458515 RepID=UPI001F1E410B|nr:hypothetical protein [Tenacibaculum piscium]